MLSYQKICLYLHFKSAMKIFYGSQTSIDMKNKTLTKIALHYRAVFLDIRREDIDMQSEASMPAMAFLARLKENGFCVSEELLHALNAVSIVYSSGISLWKSIVKPLHSIAEIPFPGFCCYLPYSSEFLTVPYL